MYAFARGYEPTPGCPSAIEYRPRAIDPALSKVYMVEEIWRIAEATGLVLRRSQAEARGALSARHAGFATPARQRSPFLRDLAGVNPTPRQTAAGINRIIDLFDGATAAGPTGAHVPKLLTYERAMASVFGVCYLRPEFQESCPRARQLHWYPSWWRHWT